MACVGSGEPLISYDLTYINRTFENLADPGTYDGALGSTKGYSNPKTYKLRGAYGIGTNSGIYIPDLRLHHTFGITVWAYLSDSSETRTIFSKDKGIGDENDYENFLDVEVSSDNEFSVRYSNGSNDYFIN